MKKLSLLTVLLLFAVNFFAQKITRGPDIGEIYFLGPTHTGSGLYYSTDFGETAVCVDSSLDAISITADKTPGGIYCVEMPSNLYYSDYYGYANSWSAKNSNINYSISSGRLEGEVYSSFYKHSNDFGSNFSFHTCNGFFGTRIDNEIDNEGNKGYVLVYEQSMPDTIYLLFTDDNFENIQIKNTFYKGSLVEAGLASGNNFGEIYINIIRNSYLENWLLYSSNFGHSFNTIDKFNLINSYTRDIVGGRQEGEIYLLYNFVNQLWQNAQIYVFHSTDFGKTFEVFHPFAKGDEPALANFSTIDREVDLVTPVEFSDFSIGEIQEYQWDFENDGIIDSYQRDPVYTYADTGWYSVKLSVVGTDSTNSFVKQDYIHVIDTTTGINEMQLNEFAISPNPFLSQLTLTSNVRNESYSVFIYSLKGVKVFETSVRNNKLFTINTSEFDTGIYILNIVTQNTISNFKIIKK